MSNQKMSESDNFASYSETRASIPEPPGSILVCEKGIETYQGQTK
jgi:hypothetical protein